MDRGEIRTVVLAGLMIGFLALANSGRLVTPAVAWPIVCSGQRSTPPATAKRSPAPTPNGGRRDAIQVMTYNIHHGRGLSGDLSLEEIAAVISAVDADIVGLQEVDRNFGSRSDFQDQPQILADLLNMNYVYGESLRVQHLRSGRGVGYYGNMILSRYPILTSEVLRLPNRWGREPRTAVKAVIDMPHIGPIAVWATHLGLSRSEREAQTQKLLAAVQAEPLPSILLGDFNALAVSREIQVLAEELQDVARVLELDEIGTFYGDPHAPRPRIDYIWAELGFEPRSYAVIPAQASDHLAVTAQLVVSSESRAVQTNQGRGE